MIRLAKSRPGDYVVMVLYGSKYLWDNIFMNFGNTLYITKILDSKILVLRMLPITGSFALQGLKSSLPSPNGKCSCTVPSSFIAAANQEVSKLLPAGVTEYPTQSMSVTKLTESYHWKIYYLAWNNFCSTTLLKIILPIEIVKCM